MTSYRDWTEMQTQALASWMSLPSRSGAHPALSFAFKHFMEPVGCSCNDMLFSAMGVLDGVAMDPIFVDAQWAPPLPVACPPALAGTLNALAEAAPPLRFNADSRMVLGCLVPESPTVFQEAALAALRDGGLAAIQSLVLARRAQMVDFLHHCILLIVLKSDSPQWPALWLADRDQFLRDAILAFDAE